MGDRAFFYSDERDWMIDRAVELGIVFHCSPLDFLELEAGALVRLYDRAIVALKRIKAQ
jgi:hypothetical protein